jgi:hypothetical protein
MRELGMSIRTIVEINHDRLSSLDNAEVLLEMILNLRMGHYMPELNSGGTPEIAEGVRVLMQRHHSADILIKSGWAEVRL